MYMQPRIKICGITTKEEIQILNHVEVDYIGFVFAQSRRKVEAKQVQEMTKNLRKDIQKVGVFVNESPGKINQIVKRCELDIVQLHGEEAIEDIQKIEVPVWKAIGIGCKEDVDKIDIYSGVNTFVLDYKQPGSGKTFCWEWIPNKRAYTLVLAGGISSSNVFSAVESIAPEIIDVSSGVETNGKKSKQKIEKLIRQVKHSEKYEI